jgi:hypothetical protein
MAFPFRLEWCDIYDDATTRVRRLPDTDGQDIARDAKVFDRARQGKGVWGNNANIGSDGYKRIFAEVFWIDNHIVHIGKYLELISNTHIIAITRQAKTHYIAMRAAIIGPHLPINKRLNHAMLKRHAANPTIRFDTHKSPLLNIEDYHHFK